MAQLALLHGMQGSDYQVREKNVYMHRDGKYTLFKEPSEVQSMIRREILPSTNLRPA